MYMSNKYNQWKRMSSWLSVGVLAILLSACSEVSDSFSDGSSPSASAQDVVTFTTTVKSMRQATRADNTLINKGETMLPTTASTATESKEGKKAGLFGCYTGQYTWGELVTLSKKASPTDEETEILKKYYSANQMYNVPATIGDNGTLTYTPLSFWPNNKLPDPATEHEYMTFWAYYPYNETSALGEYGISMTNDALGEGMGMGKVKFVMHPDAAQQNDFLISAPVVDCNRDKYPLQRTADPATYDPKPVQFRLYHMLAQVRFYAFIRGTDKMVYVQEDGHDKVADETWFDSWAVDGTIIDAYGNVYKKVYANGTDATDGYAVERTTQKAAFPTEFATDLTKDEFLALRLKIPDEANCVRWDRNDPQIWSVDSTRRRADITYQMQLNNIHTTTTLYPNYSASGTTIAFDEPTTLGSATVNHYIMNPYWFTFQNGQRTRLNDNYMFNYFEDTPVANHLNATTEMTGYDDIDGMNWTGTNDPLSYMANMTVAQKEEIQVINNAAKHYNYAPGNILLVVPQTLSDDDVTHVVITATGKRAKWNSSTGSWDTTTNPETLTAKVTVNLLKMGISWESGYIYCYAFLDDLKPGDDKVRGPESITVLFNKEWYTDQW